MLERLSRRDFVTSLSAASVPVVFGGSLHAAQTPSIGFATGCRVGEMTPSSARVWVRLTSAADRAPGNGQFEQASRKKPDTLPAPPDAEVDLLQGACPPANGRVRVRYSSHDAPQTWKSTEWVPVSTESDGIHHFDLQDLTPGREYNYIVEGAAAGDDPPTPVVELRGIFQTAPTTNPETSPVTFCVMTCQGYHDRGHPDGHPVYPAMHDQNPNFAVLTGDLVYYDNDPPTAVTPRLARYHWERMFSLPRLREFNRHFGAYWLKDDHDTLKNDSWPGTKAGQLTFETGQDLFRQQSPWGDGPSYRTFRWGPHLQLWFTDGRDFRSPNNRKDGPEKTIWGAEQKAWFQKTVKESTADWKVLVSPTPLVGPDRPKKNDNHANEGFHYEGDELRAWLKANVPDNFFVICGDRHWQYHSVHPQSGLHEFSAGPASDEHAGGTPGEDKTWHRFHRVKGGFLSVSITPGSKVPPITFRHHDVAGQVVYEFSPPAA
ncbi:PhoD-like phosphatase [Caulifigura coniformis]|uniref:PhoD-like phosphatase n=1 Tax=Caulifigura coniformis TaxID=2527983 RepID=A0A517SBP5_9PLAN|nr:alkaline phosphatase D family protein [Caulifigura coniformis]QDT53524.1 PhoD-like phosphatase [Caulifigura coniformis]